MSIPFSVSLNPFNMISSAIQAKQQDKVNKQNYAWAKEFAQNSMQWKAEDLRKAGINPVFGLGAGGYSAPAGVAPAGADFGAGMNFKISPKVQDAGANLINAKADKEKAEAKVIEKISDNVAHGATKQLYDTYKYPDGWSRSILTSDASEGLENDLVGKIAHMAKTLPTMPWNFQSHWNNLYNDFVSTGKLDPLRETLIMDIFDNYKVVKRGSPEAVEFDKALGKLKSIGDFFTVKDLKPKPKRKSLIRRDRVFWR